MDRSDLTELHYITPIANLASIMQHGLVCHQRSIKMNAQSIADPSVQDIRAPKRVPNGLKLHEYVNLYFNARNPMLFKRLDLHETICVLGVSCDALDMPGAVITNQNAASKYGRFAPSPGGLAIVDEAQTFAESWKHPDDQIAEWRHTSAMCAEVLVPNCVPPGHINIAYVSGESAQGRIAALGLHLATQINLHLFFR